MNAPAPESLVLAAQKGAVLRLTLNRPASRNALSTAMMAALAGALDDAAADSSVRAVILAANGPAFCAGHDLKEMTALRQERDKGRAAYAALFRQCSALMQQIVALPKPVIAEVQGIATAAGCQLVASCDLAVAANEARFATPGVNIGLFCSTPMVALSRNVPAKAAMEMLLTGEMIDAETAARIGLINRAVPAAALAAETMKLAEQIAAKPRATVRTGKETFYRQLEMPLAEAYDYAARVMTENMLDSEAEEGICAFLEKREPHWPTGPWDALRTSRSSLLDRKERAFRRSLCGVFKPRDRASERRVERFPGPPERLIAAPSGCPVRRPRPAPAACDGGGGGGGGGLTCKNWQHRGP